MQLSSFASRSKKNEILLSMRFIVLFDKHTLGFQSISNIGSTMDVSYIKEGGENDYPILFRNPQTTAHRLTFKRGVVMNSLGSSLYLITQSAIERKGAIGTIIVLNAEQNVKALYGFTSQGIIDWSVDDLDAEKSMPLIESFTLCHNGLVNLAIPDYL